MNILDRAKQWLQKRDKSLSMGERIDLAAKLFEEGEYPVARAVCEEILKDDPGNLEAAKWRGRALVKLGEYRRALPALEQAIAAFPEEPEVREDLARVYYALGKKDEAIDLFEQAKDGALGEGKKGSTEPGENVP